MSTTIRPELSSKNRYWIEKHRYYELKHFCLQYPIWQKAYHALDGLSSSTYDLAGFIRTNIPSDPTARCAEAMVFYSDRMDMVEKTAIEADPDLHLYILKAVTEGVSYEHLKVNLNLPCCKDTYYDLYRKFFWLLNKVRQ